MTKTQIGILLSAAPAIGMIAIAFALGGAGVLDVPPGWAADRLGLAGACAAAVGLTLVWAILEVSIGRYTSPADIAGAAFSEPTEELKIRRAILQNTLEQVVAACVAYFALAVVAPDEQLVLLPLLAAMFILGRIAFRFGYPRGAVWRAPGMALTFLPTIIAYVMILIFWLS